MEERPCDMKLVRTPFRATGIQLLQPAVLRGGRGGAGMPAGSRGVRQLISQKAELGGLKGQDGVSATMATGASATSLAAPLRVASLHHDGRLLVWDGANNTLLASCEHGASTSVVECLATVEYLFVRLESAAGSEGIEDDASVHVWSAKTFKRVCTLRGHETRVTALAVSDPTTSHALVATASLDRTARVWRVEGRTATHVQTLSLDTCGTVSSLAFLATGALIAAGSLSPLTVWHWPTAQILATVPADPTRATTVMRVVAAGTNGTTGNGQRKTSPPPPQRRGSLPAVSLHNVAVFVGCTDGFVMAHDLHLECTVSSAGDAKDAPASASWRATLTRTWQCKSHTATVESLHVDGDVLATCSMYDGAYVVNRATGVARLLGPKNPTGTTASIGCTSLAMDSANKRLLVGAHTGEVYIWNYAEFAIQAAKEVHLVASFSPHLSAVTGICLELSSGNVWERLLTCGGDGDVCVLDYRRSARVAVALPSSAANSAVLTRLRVRTASGAVDGAVAFLPATSDAVTDAALSLADETTMQPVVDGTRGLMLGKSVVAVAWRESTAELLVATSDALVLALTFQAGPTGWRKTRQWALKADYTVACFSDAGHAHGIAIGLVSRRGEGGAIAVLTLDEDVPVAQAVAYLAMPNVEPQRVVLISGRESSAAGAVVAEMRNGAVHVCKWTRQGSPASGLLIEAGPVLSPARATAASALARSRRAGTMAVSVDSASASGAATVWIPSAMSILHRRCLPSGAVEELPATRHTFATNVLSVTVVDQSGIGLVVLCEHTSDAYLCDAAGTPTHVLSATGAVAPAAGASDGPSSRKESRRATYPATSVRMAADKDSSTPSRLPYCLSVSFEKTRRYLAFAYDNGLIQLVDTSYKYVFARLWGPEGPFTATTLTSIMAVHDFVIAAADQCPLTALAVPHRALMDTSPA